MSISGEFNPPDEHFVDADFEDELGCPAQVSKGKGHLTYGVEVKC